MGDDIKVKLNECNFAYPCIEDVYNLYNDRILNILFPKNVNNKYLVYFFNMFHIFGVIMIQIGIFFPPKYMPYYLVFIIFILFGYKLLENNCFMTVISNYYGDQDDNPLYIRMETVRNLVIKNIIIAFYNYLLPKYSLYSLLKGFIDNLNFIPFKLISSFLIICLVFLIVATYIVKSGRFNVKLKNYDI